MIDARDKAERRRKRLRRWAWGMAVTTALSAIVWIGSVFTWLAYWSPASFDITFAAGSVTLNRYEYASPQRREQRRRDLAETMPQGWHTGTQYVDDRTLQWSPSFRTISLPGYRNTIWTAPLWPLVGVMGFVDAVLFRASRRCRPDLCPSCGYSLAGLSPDAKCPECGKEGARGKA